MNDLQNFCENLKPGRVPNDKVGELERLLAVYWHELSEDRTGGMKGEKILNRTEALSWTPPCVSFKIERHGATVLRSTYAELQSWTVDVDVMSASYDPVNSRNRQVRKPQPRLDVVPLVAEIISLVKRKKDDPRLKWYEDGRVRIFCGEFIPSDGPEQTVTGRRTRFRAELVARMAEIGWEELNKRAYIYGPKKA